MGETLALMEWLLRVSGVKLVPEPKIKWVPPLATFEIADVRVTCD